MSIDTFNACEAADHFLNPLARFCDLSPGEQFRFPGMQIVLTRTAGGYRRQGSPVFKTGAKTAVIPITQNQQEIV